MSIDKLRRAIARLDSYGPPPDDSPIFVDHRNTGVLFELVDGEEGPQITLADLRLIVSEN